MEILREIGPIILGLLIIPPLMRIFTRATARDIGNALMLLLSFVLGLLWSTFVGEQHSPEFEARFVALVIDTSLAFTGSAVAQWAVWSRVFALGDKARAHHL